MKTLSIVSGIALLLAIPSGWDYSYYVLLRWFICGVSAYIAYGFYNSKLTGWSLVFGGIALLFNPILPFYLDKSTWVALDLVAATIFFIAAFSAKKKE